MLEFFNMGGHAFYIWLSYGVVVAMLGYHYFSPLRRHKKLMQNLAIFYKQTNEN